jgi:hypothetical protein
VGCAHTGVVGMARKRMIGGGRWVLHDSMAHQLNRQIWDFWGFWTQMCTFCVASPSCGPSI